jgi:hypothetical protein
MLKKNRSMRFSIYHSWLLAVCMVFLLLVAGGCTLKASLPKIVGTAYFVDCQAGKDSNSGVSASSPWGTLEKANSVTLAPGDGLFFKRGTRCSGTLWPKGSGREGKPITLASYGKGPLPVIDGGKNEEAFKLLDQEYWHVQDMELTGGTLFGVLVSGSDTAGRLRHIRLTNLVVHDVYGGEVKSKTSGLVIFLPGGGANAFDDVILDGITAYNTNQWAGISILGNNQYPFDPENPGFGTDITIRNSTVHNVYGDGITLFYVKNGLIEYSVAYDTGQQPAPQTIGTPSSIWTWSCYDCTVQFNESYQASSPGVDAGCYDIDWGTRNNFYQYNYGHDSDGYCLSVFGAGGLTTTHAVLRYNICANNARRADLALRQGDVFFSTWEGGRLDGVQIYNNTFYWNPSKNAPLLINHAAFTGSGKNIFANNLIYAAQPWFIESDKTLALDHNLYWYTLGLNTALGYSGDAQPVWFYNGGIYNSFTEFQRRSLQEANGLFADPKLSDPANHAEGRPTKAYQLQSGSPAIDAGMDVGHMGPRDFFGNPIPAGKAYDIGAYEWQIKTSAITPGGLQSGLPAPDFDLPAAAGGRLSLEMLRGRPFLLSFIDARFPASEDAHSLSRSQVVFLKSMLAQYAGSGLRVVLVAAGLPAGGLASGAGDWLNMAYSWQLDGIPLLVDDSQNPAARRYGSAQTPATFLIGADGCILQRWDSLALPFQLAASLLPVIGQP